MLTQTLRGLEHNGLVARTVYPVVPPHTEYALTPLGRTLLGPLKALCEWAERHMDDVHAARAGGRAKRAASAGGLPTIPRAENGGATIDSRHVGSPMRRPSICL